MTDPREALRQVIERHWGYRTFRPLQEPAMRAVLDGRDSLVVLPTGGGKSLCYQAPAIVQGGTTVVVSPLISLMKDQVDSLRQCGVPAVQIDSTLSSDERTMHRLDLLQGEVRLLFVSPERLALDEFSNLLRKVGVRTFAIDEAHCISHWGHDFRPEYRQLRRIKELFPGASVHGYTATATERVRRDICQQLGLHEPEVLVGNFDRPNLNYRVLLRMEEERQVLETLERHKGEAGIIYCIRRADVDELTPRLKRHGVKALPYHAGLPSEERKAAQEAFAKEQCDVIVATVAFGMGINRSNIRFILHVAMPKSVEHYQQETGRAGRDGLEAECVLLYSGADFMTWKWIIEKSAEENNAPQEFITSALQHLQHMSDYCQRLVCRHKALVEYFGQKYESATCQACDVCDMQAMPDALIVAQKILSCVARVQESFGVNHVVDVLRGANTEKVRKFQHDRLSTYGLLRECSAVEVRNWIHQLIGQAALEQALVGQGEHQWAVLKLNDASWEVMRSKRSVRLLKPIQRPREEMPRSRADTASWEGVDADLFEQLRTLRRDLARDQEVPPYVIFSDATLRALARERPSTRERMRLVYGVGDKKLADFGDLFLDAITAHCRQRGVAMDRPPALTEVAPATPRFVARAGSNPDRAFAALRRGASIDDLMREIGVARSTVMSYVNDFILRERPEHITRWVPDDLYQQVAQAARQVGSDRLKPIFLALGEKVSYDVIRLVVSHLQARGA